MPNAKPWKNWVGVWTNVFSPPLAVHSARGKNNPIHLIGHSMGAQTARMLNYLLKNDWTLSRQIELEYGSRAFLSNGEEI